MKSTTDVGMEVGKTAARSVHVLVFDGFADWEPAYALAELRRKGKRTVTVVGFTTRPVVSMGGLTIVPKLAINDVRAAEIELLLLPGGTLWEGDYPRVRLDSLLPQLAAAGTPIAAICGATLALARAGLLDDRRHTSNAPDYLRQHASAYRGAPRYENALAVSDRGVITASGLGPVEFAREIFRALHVFNPADEKVWFEMFKNGKMSGAGGG